MQRSSKWARGGTSHREFNGEVVGAREGTVFAAFTVGLMVRGFQRLDAERLRKKHFGY